MLLAVVFVTTIGRSPRMPDVPICIRWLVCPSTLFESYRCTFELDTAPVIHSIVSRTTASHTSPLSPACCSDPANAAANTAGSQPHPKRATPAACITNDLRERARYGLRAQRLGEASHLGPAAGSNDFVRGPDLVTGMNWNVASTLASASPAVVLAVPALPNTFNAGLTSSCQGTSA